jgi:tetratricopeptide (TPR) repeat protein
MNKILTKIIPIIISLMMFDSAHAMKGAINDDAAQNDDAVVFPIEIITCMLSKLTLEDLSVSFVNKKWFEASQRAFPEFYTFQSSYHACNGMYKKDKNVSNILKKLRHAEKNIGTAKNKEGLVRAFLARNFDSISQTTKTEEWLLQAGFDKYPERLLQMALLRIWDTIPPVAKSPLQSYKIPGLKLLAPNDPLTVFFRQEDHFTTKCDLASELCERGRSNEVASEANTALELNDVERTELYEIALSKEPNNLLGLDYARAAGANLKLNNYKRAAELSDIALSKEPNLFGSRYAEAALANLMLKNYKRAAEFYGIAISKEPNFFGFVYAEAALANLMLKNYKRAAELYEIALSKEPNNANALFNLGFAYAKLEKIEEAAGHFKKFIDLLNAYMIQLVQENGTEHVVSVLQIMEMVFSKTSNEACLEWVHKEQQNIKNTNLSGM